MDKKVVFVVGSGRSGTHLIGRIIGSHPDVEAFIEDEKFFTLSTQIATGQIKRSKISKLVKRYNKEFSKIDRSVILEKSHTNIWMVEDLIKAFPNSLFIGIYRDVYSTVSSMLKHEGVSAWFDILPNDKANPFLGITDRNQNYYCRLKIEEKCALRWLSHKNRLAYLQEKFKDRVMVINYNELLKSQHIYLDKLSHFLGIQNLFQPEDFKLESLTKWKEFLTPQQQENIDEVIKMNS